MKITNDQIKILAERMAKAMITLKEFEEEGIMGELDILKHFNTKEQNVLLNVNEDGKTDIVENASMYLTSIITPNMTEDYFKKGVKLLDEIENDFEYIQENRKMLKEMGENKNGNN